MNFDQHFTRAVALLPGPVRERLDGDFPLDWPALEGAATGAEVAEAVRARARLPRPVEDLVHGLIRDVGIVPADVAAGRERQGAASAWIHWVTMEADGESYLLRNDRSGDVHGDVRPEAVAGYAVLGLDLAAMLHDAAERWLEAGAHHGAASEDERGHLGRCAVRMHAHLREKSEPLPGHGTAAVLARALEHAWNTQDVETRAALSGVRLSSARGARAPRRSYYAPVTGHRLRACDAGEVRWLRALAERAMATAGTGEARQAAYEAEAAGEGSGAAKRRPGSDGVEAGAPEAGSRSEVPGAGTRRPGSGPEAPAADTRRPGSGSEAPAAGTRRPGSGSEAPAAGTRRPGSGSEAPAADTRQLGSGLEASAADTRQLGSRLEAPAADTRHSGSGPEAPAADRLQLGSEPDGLTPETEVAELERAAAHLSTTVRRRLRETHGPGIAEAVDRIQDSREIRALRTALAPAAPGRTASAPSWLRELGAALLADAGAQTREGLRSARVRLEPGRRSGGLYRVSEIGTGAFGHLTPCGLVEQVRLGLAYAQDAWAALAALRNAGKEGEWTLNEAQGGSGRVSPGERETLEAAQDIGRALGRVRRAHVAAHGDGAPSALDQAAMAAEALKAVGPTVRTTAGWPGAAPAPNPLDPVDVARTATVAEGLHGRIRTIANRLIAGWVAEVQAYGESREA